MKETAKGGLKDLLKLALEAVETLHRALREEYDALTSNNLPGFEAALHKKLKYTSELEALEQSIFALLRNAGFTWDKPGLSHYVTTLSSPAERQSILRQWHRLRDAIQDCQNQNHLNGRVLNIASFNIRQALDVLTGRHSPRGAILNKSKGSKNRKGGKKGKIALA